MPTPYYQVHNLQTQLQLKALPKSTHSRHFPRDNPQIQASLYIKIDPLSIAANAIGLSTDVIRAAVTVKDSVDEFKDAPAIARNMEDEIQVVQAALHQIKAALQQDSKAIWRLQLENVFRISVEECESMLRQIDDEFDALFGRSDYRYGGMLARSAACLEG